MRTDTTGKTENTIPMRPIVPTPEKSQLAVSDSMGIKATCMNVINGRSTAINRVLVVDNLVLMGAGLECLLSEELTLEVFGVAIDSEAALVEDIRRLQPDIIILIQEMEITTPSRLLGLLNEYGRLRIISVSYTSNLFEIYDKQPIAINDRATLVEQIKKA